MVYKKILLEQFRKQIDNQFLDILAAKDNTITHINSISSMTKKKRQIKARDNDS